ncbi:hypothetical protein [Polaribacter cellanae]|uniref:Uncharacterized protein n=1 Tax=Polaribacter cellanae TaxID=2818493 RepID=A0A975CJU0_9FLAO|nr:hypothetical protein [Polaribacter cellanae]QTE21231.1 hypothetical protein J3359_10305 [Polaribacter cellanae]
MKHYKNLGLAVFLLTANILFSQKKKDSITKQSHYTFSIGKATDNSFTKSKSAQAIATFPNTDGATDSYLIDGYLDASYVIERMSEDVFSSITSIGAFYEIHKNTLVDSGKEQDVRQFGVSFNHTWGAIKDLDDPYRPSGKRKESIRDYVISGSIRKSYNRITDKNSFQAIVGFKINRLRSMKSADEDSFRFLNATMKLPEKGKITNVFQMSYDYNIGLGYIENEKVILGNIDFQLNFYPLSKYLKNTFNQEQLLFISYNYSARGELLGNLESDNKAFRTWTYGLEIDAGKTSTIQLSYNTVRGANPYKGLVDQDYDTMALKVKFSLDTK